MSSFYFLSTLYSRVLYFILLLQNRQNVNCPNKSHQNGPRLDITQKSCRISIRMSMGYQINNENNLLVVLTPET